MANKPNPADFSPSVPDFPAIGRYQPIYGKFDLTTYVQGASDYEIIAFLVQCYNATLKGYSEVTQLSKDTVTAYNQLQTWVNMWFDNLDVQKDIDNKLQQMYVDGTLADAIASSRAITPAINAYFSTNQGNDNLYSATSKKIDSMNNDGSLVKIVKETGKVEEAANEYLETVDGSKKLSDAVAKKIEHMSVTGELGRVISHTVDLQTTTTNWLNQNVTPTGSAVIVDKSLSISGAAADAKSAGDDIKTANVGIDNVYSETGEVLNRDISKWEQGTYSNKSPYAKTDSEFAIRTSEKTPISKGFYKVVNKKVSANLLSVKLWVFDSKGNLIYNSNWENGNFTFYVFEDNASYIITVARDDGNYFSINDVSIVLANYTFWRTGTEYINDGWSYKTLNSDGSTTYSNTRLSLVNVPVIIGHVYEVSVSNGYQVYAQSLTYDGKVYEEFNYDAKYTIFTRSSASKLSFLVKNTVQDGAFNIGDINLTLKDIDFKIFARENVIETGGIWWKNASYDNDTGEEVVNQYSNTRALSSLVKIWGDSRLIITSPIGYNVSLAAYDNDKTFMGTYLDFTAANTVYDISGFDGYLRFLVKNEAGSAVDIAGAPFGIKVSEKAGYTSDYYKNAQITVMSHNIGAFGGGSETGYNENDYATKLTEWVSAYRKYSPDVAGIQEFCPYFTDKADIDTRSALFNKVFAKTMSGMLLEAVAMNVNIISSNVKLFETDDPANRRQFMHLVAEKNGVIFNVVNVHLDPNSIVARKDQRGFLIKFLKTLDNFICTGDFNAHTANEYDDYKKAGFNCANCGDFGEFNTYQFSDEPTDNIITSSNFAIEMVRKGDRITSDHFALLADITILG
jgi:endonuclease/exonuclease/phosphatase family metal-dependent hydrolase|nr:MAG TPA_asm: EEP-1 [Caudoviricetes sp.]